MSLEFKNRRYSFKDEDVINWGEFSPRTKTPSDSKIWLIQNQTGTVCVVFADSEQDALDTAVDKSRMTAQKIDTNDPDYDDQKGTYCGVEVHYLGNAGEAHDLTNINVIQLPTPRMSLVGLFFAELTSEVEKLFKKLNCEYLLVLIRNNYESQMISPDQCLLYLYANKHHADKHPGLIEAINQLSS